MATHARRPPASDEALQAQLSAACTAVLKEYVRGGVHRAKAKKALIKLTKEHESCYTPHRFLARVLYHEAAVLEARQQGPAAPGSLPAGGAQGRERLELLQSALEHAKIATQLNPSSASSAALRATLVVNVLVEESTLFTRSGTASADAIKKEFQEAMAACSQAANAANPTMAEPVINISDDGSQTCDPCSLRVQDQILQWVRAGRWDCVIQEKRNVLVCMQQVLQSCHTLLDSTQIPVDGVVRLLQHILRSLLPHRPLQHDLQVWASQLLGNPAASLPESQLLLQAQQTLLKQGHQLQQPGGCTLDPLPATAQDTKAVGTAPVSTTSSPTPATQQGPAPGAAKPRPPVAGVPPPGAARPQGPMINAPPAVLHPGMSLALPLFEARDWDWDKELGGTSAATSTGGVAQPAVAAGQAAARRRTKGKAHGKPQAANNTRSKERSRKERYTDVEAFWISLNPWQRNEYLRVPLGPLLQRLRVEAGQEVLDDVCEGLAMLQERNLHTNCVWTCVMCNQKFTHAKDFLQHIEVAHEEVAVQGGKYVMCGKCQVDVVGMYYTSTCVADYSLCARCFQQELASVPEISSAYERIYPRVPSVNGPQRWSDSGSDFISTRDSFTSMEELDQLEGPATPKAVRLEGGNHWTPPGPKTGLMPAGDKPHGLPAWAASAVHQHECSPTSRQHSTSSTASAPSSPTITTTALAPGEAAPQGSSSPEPHAQQQQERGFSSPGHLYSGPEPRTRSDPPRTQQGDGSAAEGGLLSSWWPRRLLQSWNSTGQPETGKRGSSRDDVGSEKGAGSSGCEGVVPVARSFSSPEPAPSTPPPVGSHVVATSSSRTEGMVRRSSSRSSAASTAQSARRNSPIGSNNSPATEDGVGSGAGAASVLPSSCGSCGTSGTAGACADCMLSVGLDATASVAMLCGSERRQLVVVVDEIMQRVRDIYGANHAVGDMALGSIMQFTERKISALLKQHILPSQAPSVRPQLEEFLAQPACVFRKPEVLRGTLRCLTLTDLHMVLVYVVRQHAEAAASAVSPANTGSKGTGGMPRAAPAAAHYMGGVPAADGHPAPGHLQARQSVLASTGLPQHLGGGLLLEDELYDDDDVTEEEEEELDDEDDESIESSCKCDECEEDEDEQDEEEEEEEEEEEDEDDVAPPPVLELHVPEKVVFQALMVDAWHRDKEGDGDFVTVGDGSAMIKLPPMRIPEAMGLNPIVVIMEGGKPLEYDLRRHPWFSPAQWWISHLLDHPPTTTDAPAPLRSGLGPRRVLQWVFGRYVNAAAEDFLQRQRDYRAGRERDAALLDLYDDLAYGWRSLQAALDQRARLEELRKGARAQFAVVRHIEEEARHCHAEEAAEFLEVLMASHQAAMDAARAAGNPTELPRLNMCEAAVDVVRRHPALAGEPSQRYARALLDRELSALLLVEAMLAAEVDEASRARTASEDTLRKHRSEARENEAEYTRLEAEGPACHRKKDMLDKATKEAEHRERLQDLQQRLIAVTERIAAEDANKNKANDRLAEAERDLRAVRDQLCQHSTRRKHLDELCAQLEVPMPPALMHQQQQQSTAAAAMGMPLQPSYSPITATVTVPYPSDMSPPGEPSRPTNPDFASPPAAALAPIAPATPASEPTASTHTVPPAPQGPASPANQATSSPTTPFASPPPVPVFLPAIPPPSTEHLASPASPTPTAMPASLSSPTALLLAPGREMPSGHALASAVTLEEWHKQRLEVLMYRLMWVSEAVKSFQDQYSSHARTRHYELFLKATSWAKSLADEYEQQVRGWYNELDKLRDKLLEQSCWDIGLMLGPHLLEIIRRRIEHGARQAQEKASLSLLEELEAEESHTSKGKASAGGAGTGAAGAAGTGVTASAGTVAGAGAGGKNANKNAARKQKVADKAREKKEREEAEKQARLAESEARRRAEEEERLRLAEARRAREVAIDAELERRRQELEGLEALREAEAIHAAQEASLREAARAAAVREQQQQQYEASMQQALQEAKAAQAAAALARQQVQAAGAMAAPAPTATSNAGRQLGTVRNGMRGNATAEPAAKATLPQAQGSNAANGMATAAATANASGNTAVAAKTAKPGTLRAQIREAQGANPAAAARQHHQQQRTSTVLPPAALTARSSSSSTAAEPPPPDAVVVPPRAPANKHAPKFTSPAVVAANHARNASAYAAGRGSAAPSDAQKPAALQQQGQHSNAAATQQHGKATGGRHVANAPHTNAPHNSVPQANALSSNPPHSNGPPSHPPHTNAPPSHPPCNNAPPSNGPYNAAHSNNPRNGAPYVNAPHNSVPLANGHVSLHPHPHANGHELHDMRHAHTANGGPATGLAGAHQRGGVQVHAASLANSPATRQPRASPPMPQTPEQRPAPGILATATQPAPPLSPASATQLPTAAAPPPGPGAMPQYRGMGAAPGAPQHDTGRQADLLSGLGFNPFAENPLLRALQGPERAASPVPVSPGLSLLGPGGSPIHAPPPSHVPHSQLTSPRSPGDHLCSPNALGSRPAHLEGGYAFQHHMHHALHTHAPATPNNATVEPATDHILSIMSILEPDAQSSRSPVAPYAFKSQGSSSLAGSGSAGSTGRQYSQGAANGDHQQQQQQSNAQSGEQQCTPRAATSTVKPVPGQHLLAGLSQGTGGFSIWSHQASEHQGTDAWAMHSAGSTPSAAEVRQGSRDGNSGQQNATANAPKPGVVSMLSSAAAPWTGSATFSTSARALGTPVAGTPQQQANTVNSQQQQQQQQHADLDMASLLPASLLPASLEPDSNSSSLRSSPVSAGVDRSANGSMGSGTMRPGLAAEQQHRAMNLPGARWQSEAWAADMIDHERRHGTVPFGPARGMPPAMFMGAAKQHNALSPGLGPAQRGLMHPYLHGAHMMPNVMWPGHAGAAHMGPQQAVHGLGEHQLAKGWALPYQFPANPNLHSSNPQQQQAGPWSHHQ